MGENRISKGRSIVRNELKLLRTVFGYYQYSPLPTENELQEYYVKKYYQEGKGSYDVKYSSEEIAYFQLKADMMYRTMVRLAGNAPAGGMLDVGCGEGWVMNVFQRNGHPVVGFDFSRYGIEKWNPDVAGNFRQGNIYEQLREAVVAGRTHQFVVLANVIEHVIDPISLLRDIRKLLTTSSVLAIVAPNDFSKLHEHLLEHKRIGRKFWLAYPDHLSYFSKESMANVLSHVGLSLKRVVADNPIDLNLLNDNSNYIEDPSKGKQTHFFRVRQDNFLASISVDGLLKVYEALGEMGVGRDLTYYCTIA